MLIGTAIHILAALIAIGGIFFVLVILKTSGGTLAPAAQLALWERNLSRFLVWAWVSIAALFASGVAMVLVGFGGFDAVGGYVRTMAGLALLMTLIFAYLQFLPLPRFQRALAAADLIAASKSFAQARLLLAVNLILGIVTAVIGAGGRYYG